MQGGDEDANMTIGRSEANQLMHRASLMMTIPSLKRREVRELSEPVARVEIPTSTCTDELDFCELDDDSADDYRRYSKIDEFLSHTNKPPQYSIFCARPCLHSSRFVHPFEVARNVVHTRQRESSRTYSILN